MSDVWEITSPKAFQVLGLDRLEVGAYTVHPAEHLAVAVDEEDCGSHC